MSLISGLAFVALGISIALVQRSTVRGRNLSRVLASLTATVALVRLLEHTTRLEIGLEKLVFPATWNRPIGMAFFTAANMLTLSVALLLLASGSGGLRNTAGGLLGFGSAFLGLTFLLGYVYGSPLVYGAERLPIPLNTAICFLLAGGSAAFVAIEREQAQRRAARHRLRESEERTRLIIETANDAFVEADTNGTITDWNRQAEHLFGWPRTEALGRALAETIVPEDERVPQPHYTQHFGHRSERPAFNRPFETRLMHRSGGVFTAEVTVWLLTSRGVQRLNAFVRDITQQKLAEEEIARQNAIIRQDLEFARKFQQALLPNEYPRVPSPTEGDPVALSFHHVYRPTLSLGGDFFYFAKLSDHRAGVLIADVMGHGARSALVAAILRSVIEGLVSDSHDPATFLAKANEQYIDIVGRSHQFVFVTACYIVIDTQNATATCACAGHPSPLLAIQRGGRVEEMLKLDELGMALGFVRGVTYTNVSHSLTPGDSILLFTDGVMEAANDAGEQFGPARLVELIRENMGERRGMLPQVIVAALNSYAGSNAISDDVCVVEVEVTERARLEAAPPARHARVSVEQSETTGISPS